MSIKINQEPSFEINITKSEPREDSSTDRKTNKQSNKIPVRGFNTNELQTGEIDVSAVLNGASNTQSVATAQAYAKSIGRDVNVGSELTPRPILVEHPVVAMPGAANTAIENIKPYPLPAQVGEIIARKSSSITPITTEESLTKLLIDSKEALLVPGCPLKKITVFFQKCEALLRGNQKVRVGLVELYLSLRLEFAALEAVSNPNAISTFTVLVRKIEMLEEVAKNHGCAEEIVNKANTLKRLVDEIPQTDDSLAQIRNTFNLTMSNPKIRNLINKLETNILDEKIAQLEKDIPRTLTTVEMDGQTYLLYANETSSVVSSRRDEKEILDSFATVQLAASHRKTGVRCLMFSLAGGIPLLIVLVFLFLSLQEQRKVHRLISKDPSGRVLFLEKNLDVKLMGLAEFQTKNRSFKEKSTLYTFLGQGAARSAREILDRQFFQATNERNGLRYSNPDVAQRSGLGSQMESPLMPDSGRSHRHYDEASNTVIDKLHYKFKIIQGENKKKTLDTTPKRSAHSKLD